MSSTVVDVATIEKISPHPGADRLVLAQIKGWQSVIRKNEDGSPQFAVGQKVVFIPPNATLPREMAEKLGVVTYLAERTDMAGDRVLVVRQVRLRGEPSFGLLIPPADPAWEIGRDVRELYGIGKYNPPVKFSAGDSEPSHPLFQKFTDVENLRNFPDVLQEGEEVFVSEKIHGTSGRLGWVEGELLAGSHALQRKRPAPEELESNTYWYPSTLPEVMRLLDELREKHPVAIVYGEIYGSKVQSLAYGKKGRLGFAAFDILLDDRYVDPAVFEESCARHGVATVPFLYRGPFNKEKIVAASRGKTTLADDHIREGVVVRPAHERFDPKVGRVILKYIGDDYLLNDKLAATDATDL